MKWLSFLAFAAALAPAVLPAIDSPFDVGSASQLFIDQVLVGSSERIVFTQHSARKHPDNPLLKADQPWEGWRIECYGNVLFDQEENLFKMWYVGDQTAAFPSFATFYATSKDGITWSKPLVGTIKAADGTAAHNAVVDACHLASVIKDAADPDPARRYKMVCWIYKPKPEGGPHTLTSPDGLNWTRLSKEPICRSNDVITAFYDAPRKQYVAFPKHSTAVRGGPVRRCFALTTSTDFLTWTAPRYVLVPDQRDDAGSLARIEEMREILDVPDDPALMRTEFYGVGVHPAESCVVIFPWMFTINNNARYGNQEGPGELQLGVTRDLQSWERPFRTPVVPRGKAGEWDCGFFSTAAQAITVGDEIRLYYSGSNYTHGTPCLYREEGTGRGAPFTGSIGLATWQRDRFASADAGAEGGVLTTVPIRFSGHRLEINADIKPGGQLIIELQDLKGQSLGNSQPLTGDHLRHPVQWESDPHLSELTGRPITLRFHLRQASLFAFAFRA
jgi:hypothetical protein